MITFHALVEFENRLFSLKGIWHERAFKVMKNSVYFIVIALTVAELYKILVYAN